MADEVLAMEARLNDLISKNLDKINSNLKKFEGQSKKTFDNATKASDKTSKSLALLKRSVGGLIAFETARRFVVSSSKAFLTFEKRMAEVNTIAKLNTQQLEALGGSITKMTERLPKSADELGAGFYQILSAGITDTADALQVLESATELAVAGVANTGETVKLVTGIINAFGFEMTELERVSDVLFKTVEKGVTTIPALANSLGRVIPLAKAANISFEKLAAAVATLTVSGLKTEEAVVALRGAIKALAAPTEQAEKEAKRLGLTLDGDLFDVIKQFEGFDPKAISKIIPEVRAQVAVLTLANNFKKLEENIVATFNASGAKKEAFDRQMNTHAANVQLIVNKWEQVKRAAGEAFVVTAAAVIRTGQEINKNIKRSKEEEFATVDGINRTTRAAIEAAKEVGREKDQEAVSNAIEQAKNVGRFKEAEFKKLNNIKEAAEIEKKIVKELTDEQIEAAQRRVQILQEIQNIEFEMNKTGLNQFITILNARVEAFKGTENEKKLFALQIEQEITDLRREATQQRLDEVDKEIQANEIKLRKANKIIEDNRKKIESEFNTVKAFASNLGAAFASGIGKGAEGFKESLKGVLLTTLSFIEKQILLAFTSAGLQTVFSPAGFSQLAKVAAISAGFGALKAGVNAFQGGTDSAPGGRSLVGEGGPEIVDIPKGSQVFNNQQTKNILGGSTFNIIIPEGTPVDEGAADRIEIAVGVLMEADREGRLEELKTSFRDND